MLLLIGSVLLHARGAKLGRQAVQEQAGGFQNKGLQHSLAMGLNPFRRYKDGCEADREAEKYEIGEQEVKATLAVSGVLEPWQELLRAVSSIPWVVWSSG